MTTTTIILADIPVYNHKAEGNKHMNWLIPSDQFTHEIWYIVTDSLQL